MVKTTEQTKWLARPCTVRTYEDEGVSEQHLVRSSYMDVRLLSKLIKIAHITTPN